MHPPDSTTLREPHPVGPFEPAPQVPTPDQNVAFGVWTFTDYRHRPIFAKPWDGGEELQAVHGWVKFWPIASAAALAELLTTLKRCPDTCIMSGQYVGDGPAAAADGEKFQDGQAKYRPGLARRSTHYWRDDPNRIFRVDFDGQEFDGIADAVLSFKQAALEAADALPDCLPDADVVVSASSKAGAPAHLFKAGQNPTAFRGHLFVLLDTPRTLAEQRQWAELTSRHCLNLDMGIYTPSRLLRTAAPLIGPYVDPLGPLRMPFVAPGNGLDRAPLPATPPGFKPVVPRDAAAARTDLRKEWDELGEIGQANLLADLRGALRYLPADCPRAQWIGILTALRTLPDDHGAELAVEWSATGGAKYAGEDECRAVFDGMGADRTHWKAVFAAARTYGWRAAATIDASAVGFGTPSPQACGDGTAVPAPAARSVVGLVTREQQIAMFANCVGVLRGKGDSAWVLTPTGDALSKSQFDDLHGGHEFLLGGTNNRVTRHASEAFFEHRDIKFPVAHAAGFRPQLPFQALYEAEGRTMVNTYRPLGKRRSGDASPMVEHVRRIFPEGDDATILLSYLAAMVQYPGRKFTWCPVLQSGPGTGKGLIAGAMFTALGAAYCKQLEEIDLKSQFNGWLEGSLMCYFPEMSRRVALKAMERLKVLITDGRNQGVERKNRDKVSVDVCANFLFMTNYKDAVAKDANDRRFCIMYSAMRTAEDLNAAGMGAGSAYFRNLHAWLANGGEAIFANWLATYEIPEQYDPTKGAHVAPVTSSTARAIELGRSDVAEVIAEAIEDEVPGFIGGWLSWGLAKVRAVDRLSVRNVTVEKLRLAVASLGFERCSVLTDGKTDNPVQPDGKRATLYSRGLGDFRSMSKADVARAYSIAQEGGQFGVRA